jgi:hypothetical protein
MKKLTLTLCAVGTFAFAFNFGVFAGPEQYSGKEMKQAVVTPPACEWYRGNEWDISIWGAYAFPGNDGRRNPADVALSHETNEGLDNHEENVGRISNDRFLNKDDAWGGGVDLKYFLSKYIGIGVEGYGLAARDTVGGVLGTLTLRYPIGCSRLAPYIFGGIGGAFGGSEGVLSEDAADNELFTERNINRDDALLEGEVGGGLEFRFTRHVGIMADFSWHFLDKADNNFGMVRSGVTFAF